VEQDCIGKDKDAVIDDYELAVDSLILAHQRLVIKKMTHDNVVAMSSME
jgi:hypothetical protein